MTLQPIHRRWNDAPGFTLVELLVVTGIIAVLARLLLPGLSGARRRAAGIACISNQRQIGLSAPLYMSDHRGGMFHHHEGWVLDDGSQVDELPSDLSGVTGGGMGASDAEKPWVIFLQPYLKSRQVTFCPADRTSRSRWPATDLVAFNGGARVPMIRCRPAAGSPGPNGNASLFRVIC